MSISYNKAYSNVPVSTLKEVDVSLRIPLRFGLLNPTGLKKENWQVPKTRRPLWQRVKIIAAIIFLTPLGMLQRSWQGGVLPTSFAASADLTKRNHETLKKLGATCFDLTSPRAEITALKDATFKLRCGYISSDSPSAHQPTVLISLSAAGNIAQMAPFIRLLKKQHYAVLIYEHGLLDEKGKHLGKYKRSLQDFQTALVNDHAFISQTLNNGLPINDHGQTVRASYTDQILVGHSIGAATTIFSLATHPERHYRGAIVVTPPATYCNALRNFCLQATRWIPPAFVVRPYKHFYDSTEIEWSKLQTTPVMIVGSTRDSLVRRDPETVFESMRDKGYAAPLTFVHLKDETHSNPFHETWYSATPHFTEPQRYTDCYEEQPYVRLMQVFDDFFKHRNRLLQDDPNTGKYEGVVRFAGTGK